MTIKQSVTKAISMLSGTFTADTVLNYINTNNDKPISRDAVMRALRELTHVVKVNKNTYRAKGRAV